MHASLPEDMEETTIASLQTGETAYIVPWAMCADQDRKLWLTASHTAHRSPGGTVQMRIERTENGFRVWAVRGHRYQPKHLHPEEKLHLPVEELTRAPMTDAEQWDLGLRLIASKMTRKEWDTIRMRELESRWDRAFYSKRRAER